MKKITALASLCAALSISSFSTAQAADIRLDGVGFDVIYDDALVGLFGTPLLLGSTLVFNPTSFAAMSSGPTWAFTSATVGFTLVADSGFTLGGASLVERGDYLKFGNASTVLASGQTSWYDYRTPTVLNTETVVGAEAAALTVHDLPVITNWQATASSAFDSGATTVHFTLQNLLAANAASAGDLAFIEKKYVALTVSLVPEASQYAMLLAGLGLIGVACRRSRVG